jgi:4-amino-4-deoxy-L-arabinose transferase-like glycosyltransferase
VSTDNQPVRLFGRWSFWQLAAVLFVATCLCGLYRVGNLPLTKSDETRFTEASREMLDGGNWIVPHFNNEYRFDKPPLIYWCQAPLLALFGNNDLVARAHSAVAAGLLVVVIFAFGARMFHPVAGFWAAVIFATSFRVMVQASLATSDMLLALCGTLAFWAGWELLQSHVCRPKNPHGSDVTTGAPVPLSPQRGEGVGVRGGMDQDGGEIRASSPSAWRSGWWWMFYASLALSFLAKGPAGWMPLFALPVYRWWAKPAAFHQRFRLELGLPLMLGLLALWAVPAYIGSRGEYLRVGIGGHVITRMTQGYDGHGASNFWMYLLGLPYYFLLVWGSFIGWSTWFPWCYKQLRGNKFGGSTERYLLSGILVTFVIFTLGWSRRGYYTMPAFPLIALLLAGLWWRAGRSQRVLGRLAAVLTIISLVVMPPIWIIANRTEPAKQLVHDCVPYLHPESAFATVDLDQSSLVWYFRQHVRDYRRVLKPEEAAAFMAQPGPRFCVVENRLVEKLFPVLPVDWKRIDAPNPGFYSARRYKFLLTVLIKP